jgi:hypothetical protein
LNLWTGHATLADSTGKPTVRERPPSTNLVVEVPEYEGSELVEFARLLPRTVRYALRKLGAKALVVSPSSFVDARRRLYPLSIGEP